MALKLYSTNIGGGGSVSFPIQINQGGTGQTTATLAFNALSPQTTKGDIIGFDGTNAVRFAQGASGTILSYDPSTSAGLRAVAPLVGTLPVPISQGGTGTTTAILAFNALSPLTTKGDLVTDDGTNNVRFAAGASGQILSYDASTSTGLRAIALTIPVLPVSIAQGGTGTTTAILAFNALSPLTTKGDIVTDNGTNNVRLAAGSDYQWLRARAAATNGIEWFSPFAETNDGNSSTAITIDFSGQNFAHKVTLTGNVTFTFTAPSQAGSALVIALYTGSGSFTATWPATVKWSTAPTVTTTASRMDLFNFYYAADGNYYGSYVQNFTP